MSDENMACGSDKEVTPVEVDNLLLLKEEIMSLRKENELLIRRLQVLENSEQESSVVSNDGQRQFPETKFSASEIKDIVEPFDPASSSSVSDWIANIDNLKSIYGWEDRSVLFYAIMRLQGAAKYWYQSKRTDIKNWYQFKSEIEKSFPDQKDDSEILVKIMTRKRKRDECVENYFYSIAAYAKKIKLSAHSTMNYIISGLGDRNLINVLTAANCATLPELLARIKRYEDIQEQENRREILNRNTPPTSSRPRHREEDRQIPKYGRNEMGRKINFHQNYQHHHEIQKKLNNKRNVRCFRCDAIGHVAKDCKIDERKRLCYYCKESGHFRNQCPKVLNTNKNIGQIANEIEGNGKEYYPEVEVNGVKIKAFLDLGSDVTTITKNTVRDNSWKTEKCDTVLHGFGGSKCEVNEKIIGNIMVGNINEEVDLLVVPDSCQSTPIIIGRNLLDRKGIKITKRPGQFEIVRENTPSATGNNSVEKVEQNSYKVQKIKLSDVQINSVVDKKNKEDLVSLINNFRECFSKGIQDIGQTDLVMMKIELKEQKVIQYKPYKVPYGLKSTLSNTISDLLSQGIIRPSTSEYASPAIMVQKKSGEYRMCIDYRKLNSITKREQFPVPNIEETLNCLANKKIFTSLDFQSGYYQISIEEASKQYTAFITTEGHYEFNRMPFGLTNSPAVFMRLMSKLIQPLKRMGIIVYMDDILISTETIHQNLEIIKLLLAEIEKAGLTLNLEKCEFLKDKLEFLGHEITGDGIKPGIRKTGAVENFQRPTNTKEVKQFLGLTGYFRRFVKNYAYIALPLNRLLKKDAVFRWEEEEEKAFQKLKNILVNRPILALYDEKAQHEVHTDASSHGLAGILMQIAPNDDKLRAVSYFSRATTPTESKYHSYELEALAVVESLERFKHYTLMKKFRVVTDCNSLKMTHEKRNLIPRIARWWLKIQQYDFELVFRSGKRLAHADALSRSPWEEGKDVETVAAEVLSIGLSEEDWISTLQMQDPWLKQISDVLKGDVEGNGGRDGIKGNYKLEQGRLYKRTDLGNKLVIPKGLKWRILKSMHDDKGHCGVNRTLENVRKHFWFSHMKPTITKYVNSCIDCLYNKRSGDEHRYVLNTYEILPVPFHTVHIDHLGPFPKSKGGNQFVIGLVDAFTKFVVFKATKTTATKSVVRMLDEICQYFGLPTRIVTDRGSSFSSKEFGKYCFDNAIKHTMVAVKTPRANGQIERYFRTLKTAIATMTQDSTGRDWDKHVVKIQIALNSSKHSVTKRTPQEVLMGYTPRNITDNKITLIINDVEDRHAELNLESLREDVKKKIERARQNQAKKHNESTVAPRKYKKGDLVLIKQESAGIGQPRKIQMRFRGPYEVKSEIGRDRYVIGDTEGLRITQKPYESIHSAENLRPWCALTDICFDESDAEEEGED